MQIISSVAQSCPTLCNPMDCSTLGLPVHHQLLQLDSNSCSLSRWCHPTISSSVVPLPSHLQSFPASGSFPMSQFFPSGGNSLSIGVSALASVLPMNIHGWFPLRMDLLDLLAVQGTLKSLLQHQYKSINFSALSFLYSPTLTSIHDYWKNHSFD